MRIFLSLTDKERQVVIFVAAVIITGSVLRAAGSFFPREAGLLDDAKFRPRTNINSATFDELVSIPYIGEYTAERILEHREERGALRSFDELRDLPGMRPKNFERILPFVSLK